MDPERRCDASATLGAVLWIAVVGLGGVDLVATAVLLAVLVLVPTALPLAATPRRDGTHARAFRWAVVGQPPAAALFAVSALVPHGLLAAGLALPWVGVTLLLARFGLWRLLPRGLAPPEETLLDAGLLYLPVGALAALAVRLDAGLGYGLTIIHLTAAHYHYATFLLPVVAAALGRHLASAQGDPGTVWWRAYRVAAALLVVGVPFVAAGITASPALEAVAGTTFALAVILVAVAFLRTAGSVRDDEPAAAALLSMAGLSITVAMTLAVAYAVGQWIGPRTVGVATMIPTHGLLNAFGFALPAVLAWRRLDPPVRARAPGIPFSPLTARWRVGPDYAERTERAGEPLAGQVDDVADYRGDRFDPDPLAPAVARFYERTAEYRLSYRARWHRPFRRAAGLAMALAGRIEQLSLPTDGNVREMVGRCPEITGEEPRADPRFWVRTDPETGEGVFVAAYGVHRRNGTAYMNIGMPLPGANLTAVLVPRNAGVGLELSSAPERGGDAGLWLVLPPIGPVKLPVEERFHVRPTDDPDAPAPPDDGEYGLTAVHEMGLFGRPFLSIQYGIARDQTQAPD